MFETNIKIALSDRVRLEFEKDYNTLREHRFLMRKVRHQSETEYPFIALWLLFWPSKRGVEFVDSSKLSTINNCQLSNKYKH